MDLATEVRDEEGQSMRAIQSCMLLSHWHWIIIRTPDLSVCVWFVRQATVLSSIWSTASEKHIAHPSFSNL